MEYEYTFDDILTLLKRRLRLFIFTVVVMVSLGIALIYTLPPVYESTGTVLVESQQIPSEFVQSTITSAAEERIRLIEQRVVVRSRLQEVLDKFELYQEGGANASLTDRIDRLKENLTINIENVSSANSRRRNSFEDSVVFSLTFSDQSPDIALRITNEFITLFLEENVRSRTERAVDTTEFLTQELERLEEQLFERDEAVILFKRENARALPEHLNLHFSMLERAKADLVQTQSDARLLQADLRLLETEISALQSGRNDEDSQTLFTPQKELVDLQTSLSQLRLQYKDNHPEVISVLDRIRVLRERIRLIDLGQELAEEIAKTEARILELNASGTARTSEIDRLETKASQLNQELSEISSDEYEAIDKSLALDTARLEVAKSSIITQLGELDSDTRRYRGEIRDLEQRIQLTPRVESELRALERDYRQTLSQFQDLQQKKQEAELAQNLEEDQKAERFLLIDPPIRPENPTKPNRIKLMALLIVGVIGASSALIFGKDVLFGSLLSARHFKHILGDVPVASVPYITLTMEDHRRRIVLIALILGLPVLAIATALTIHVFVRPLDSILLKLATFL